MDCNRSAIHSHLPWKYALVWLRVALRSRIRMENSIQNRTGEIVNLFSRCWTVLAVVVDGHFHVRMLKAYGFVQMKRESHKTFIRIAPSPFANIKMFLGATVTLLPQRIADKMLHLQSPKWCDANRTIVVKITEIKI